MEENNTKLSIYQDEELKAAVQELFGYQSFLNGMKAFLPAELNDLILQAKDGVENVYDFQKNIIRPLLKFIEKISMTRLTSSGLENLRPEERYLFISNHRDIGLDTAFLNVILFEHGFQTSQIAIGDNLMKHRIAELIFRINKSFEVKRSGTPRELYNYSVQLSNYIKKQIGARNGSIWISQREGRAKDGNDQTQVAMLKMLRLSGTQDLKKHFQDFHIVPVSISYEYDPCALLKTQEFLRKQADPGYKKSFEDDVAYILQGLKGPKGRVHFHYGKPLQEELEVLDTAAAVKQQLELLAKVIDREIHLNYRLNPVNYIAHDLLSGSSQHADHYTPEELSFHRQFFQDQILQLAPAEQAAGRKYLLAMYANPVINASAWAG